ncbi:MULTISPECIES: trimeric intracellular cation channel family protein [Halorussus]|uniref:trimeric intracellular cation channel family protein n=1 Tax=Halorussus TaxID=1070314 RepID=UPI0020A09EE6|nr:trimeric intracellular cation channel family protein [Halorussus vallis]USZ77731.1 trimeric intracellular cation channel family protein [Halorussus vallis]
MNVIGLLAFAVVGSLRGADADLDLLGVAVLGVMTALGGGVTRDLLVDTVPVALRSTTDVSVALVGVGLAVALARLEMGATDHSLVLLADAVGLSAFATTGALVATTAGLSPFGVVVLATVTGVGGGLVSDVLLRNVPFVLVEDFYATCAVLGGVVFWVAISAGAGRRASAVVCAAFVFGLRLLAIRHDWELPTV